MKLLASFAALVSGLLIGVAAAGAFEPQNIRWYPGSSTSSPMVAKVAATSTMTWEAINSFGYSGWRDVVDRSLSTGSSDTDSLGNTINRFLAAENRGQIMIREIRPGESADILHFAVSSAFLEAKCGTGDWYTACVLLLNPVPGLSAYYRAAAMMPWPYTSQAAVVRHESFHAIGRACDQYRGGYPRASDGVWEGQVVCTGNPDSLMDCGGAARTVTAFDYETFKGAFVQSATFLQVQAPPPICVPVEGSPCWTGEGWKFANGWGFVPNSGCGNWYDPFNRHAWGDCSDYGRWSPLVGKWVRHGGAFFDPAVNYHYEVP